MNFSKITSALIFSLMAGCGGMNSSSSPTPTVVQPPQTNTNVAAHLAAVGSNVMSVTVNGSQCGSGGSYINQPCVTIKLCTPGTTSCQTINNILLDTGSYGLRVFKSVVTSITLPDVTDTSGNTYGTCATFGSGASWGSVKRADVVLGDLSGSDKATVPIQFIDDSFAGYASHCSNGEVDHTPAASYFNGILGVGLFNQDCGASCVNYANLGMYYSCTSSTCTAAKISLANQVANPIPSLPVNNNGAILSLPAISSSGATSSTGNFILGIGTQSNNTPDTGLYFFQANSQGYITNTYNSTSTQSLFDSGTNGYAFYDSTIPNCSSSSAFYCPTSNLSLSGVQTGSNGTSAQANFVIANSTALFNSGNSVFNDISFEIASSQNFFVYGLPFHYGRSIFIGVQGKSSTLGSGLYWAY